MTTLEKEMTAQVAAIKIAMDRAADLGLSAEDFLASLMSNKDQHNRLVESCRKNLN